MRTSPQQVVSKERPSQQPIRKRKMMVATLAVIASLAIVRLNWNGIETDLMRWMDIWRSQRVAVKGLNGTMPLVMKGGDPYIRALMRTISASEANYSQPYHVVYGGKYVSDLNRHPNRCVRIPVGPNKGNCSTAAGRYQMLNRTWREKARRYHPHPTRLLVWTNYSFEPEYQDRVTYAWLSDRQYWKADISQMLREGKVRQVLRMLSGTWTSLGYGIETNSMSRHLPAIYQRMLREELSKTR